MLTRILTLTEFRAWYKLGEKSARKMLHSGQIVALKTPSGWRIPDVGPHLLELTRRHAQNLEEVPFIRGVEAAAVAGISNRRLRQLAEAGEVEYRLHGNRRLYALRSLMAYISRRGRNRTQRDGYSRPCVKRWAQELIAKKSPLLPYSQPGEASPTVTNPTGEQS